MLDRDSAFPWRGREDGIVMVALVGPKREDGGQEKWPVIGVGETEMQLGWVFVVGPLLGAVLRHIAEFSAGVLKVGREMLWSLRTRLFITLNSSEAQTRTRRRCRRKRRPKRALRRLKRKPEIFLFCFFFHQKRRRFGVLRVKIPSSLELKSFSIPSASSIKTPTLSLPNPNSQATNLIKSSRAHEFSQGFGSKGGFFFTLGARDFLTWRVGIRFAAKDLSNVPCMADQTPSSIVRLARGHMMWLHRQDSFKEKIEGS
ncbi:uncharacterized protein LOC133737597 [Rosa rugosa]|uniref:uncharacterized protein LOC133737597 n=1 Tax=Rosa rugosa TaxID=74645 RepID=UPI002B417B34|nr:uncharacterized protein LOC133737597 [Rosa rugosa]